MCGNVKWPGLPVVFVLSVFWGESLEEPSHPFSTEALSTQQALRVGDKELAFEITTAPPPALRTKVVTFAPRYILHNTLRSPIAYRQAKDSRSADT